MPRGGRSSSRSPPSRSSFASSKPATQAPPRPAQTQPTQASSGGMFSGLGSTLMTGMAFGAGSEVAHQAVRGLMGGSGHQEASQQQEQQHQQYTQQSTNPCQFEITNFSNCLKDSKDISFCQRYSDLLKMCQDNQQ